MKPVNQTKLHSETVNGNCLAAALASILEIDIDDVPEFEDMGDNWGGELADWLDSIGFYIMEWQEVIPDIPGYFLVCGESPRGVLHEVVYFDGKMVHDPHPSNAGITTVKDVFVLVPKDPSKQKISNEM